MIEDRYPMGRPSDDSNNEQKYPMENVMDDPTEVAEEQAAEKEGDPWIDTEMPQEIIKAESQEGFGDLRKGNFEDRYSQDKYPPLPPQYAPQPQYSPQPQYPPPQYPPQQYPSQYPPNRYAQHPPRDIPVDINAKPKDEYRWSFADYEATGRENKPTQKKRSINVFTALISSVFILGAVCLCAYGAYALFLNYNEEEAPLIQESSSNSDVIAEELIIKDKPLIEDGVSGSYSESGISTVEIAKKVTPSVVSITTYQAFNTFTPAGTASGIIISEDGYIITNAHVVADAIGINVELYNGESYTAKVIGSDTRTDLTVLKIAAENLAFAEFGNSEELEVGERVIAIGNPGGVMLAGSVTQGIVSGVNRSIDEAGSAVTYIQVDAAINPGNSGGALVNTFSQIIGINCAKIVDVNYEGIGFAIPVHVAEPIINDLINFGYVTGRTKIGIEAVAVTETLAQINGVPTGVSIQTIDPSSDLAGKDAKRGDIITHVNGVRIAEVADVTKQLEGKNPGDIITMSLYRATSMTDGKNFDISVALMADVEEPINRK